MADGENTTTPTMNRQPEPFDLVELAEPFDDLPAGARGTVIVGGLGRALVDFAWSDAMSPGDVPSRSLAVPYSCLSTVTQRTWAAAIGHKSARQAGGRGAGER